MNIQVRELSAVDRTSFVSQASYWIPELLNVSAWLEHAPFGFWLVGALRPRTIVELGVHTGFSYSVFCQAVERLHLPTRFFAIAAWRGDQHAGYYGDDVFNAVRVHNRRYDSFSRLIRADFADALGEFADGSIDLLHIDGCHSYEAVRRDFETWLPKLSPRGVVIIHDTAEVQPGFGVWQFWAEVAARYPSFNFEHSHGLGVLVVGSEPDAPIERVMRIAAKEPNQVRNFFTHQGSRVEIVQAIQYMVIFAWE